MRILYSRTHFWFDLKGGGSVGHTLGVLQGLAQLGRVECISNESIYGNNIIPCEIIKPIGRGWLGELFYNFTFMPHLAAKIGAFKPDFVYHRYNGYSFATAKVCRRLGVPLVLEFNSSDLWKIRYWGDNNLKGWLTKPIRQFAVKQIEPFNLKYATKIVVVSEPLKESLVSSGISEKRILVNPNAVDLEKFRMAEQGVHSEINRELGISTDRIVVGFSGTFGEWHGVPELTEAVMQLNNEPSWREKLFFVLIGDGKLRPMIQHQIGHFENVRFVGTVEYKQIQEYLSICDILLSPHGKTPDGGKFFGSPTKIFEYMAMGKGIVASNLDQIGDVLKDGDTAYLAEPGNVDEIVGGIKYFADHPDEAERMGKNARQVVCKQYSWKQNAQRVVNIFQ